MAALSQTVLNDPAEDYFRKLNRVDLTGYYATLQGTSMSSPNACGGVALLLQAAMEMSLPQSPEDMKNYIAGGARIDTIIGNAPNNDWGFGKFDVLTSYNYMAFFNQPPVADAGADVTVADDDNNGSEQVTLDGSGSSDPDGSIVSYEWSGPGAACNTATCDVTVNVGSTESFTLKVTDNDGATDTDTVLVTVTQSNPPTTEICTDGVDNDNDGYLDCRDPDCGWGTSCQSNSDCTKYTGCNYKCKGKTCK